MYSASKPERVLLWIDMTSEVMDMDPTVGYNIPFRLHLLL